MAGAFLGPLALLELDDPGIDAVASGRQRFAGDFFPQALPPELAALRTAGTLRQAAAEDLEGAGK